MFLNNIKGIISYITISAITICFFSLIGQNIFFDELNIIPFGLVPIIGSVAYIVVGFFILDSSRKPVFSSVISVAVILETLALVTFAMEGQYPSDILYCYTNIVYVMVLGLYGPLMIAPILPSLFMCIGIIGSRNLEPAD